MLIITCKINNISKGQNYKTLKIINYIKILHYIYLHIEVDSIILKFTVFLITMFSVYKHKETNSVICVQNEGA